MAITSPAPEASSRASGAGDVPVRADGVELLGELPGSGYREPPALVRRSDGQTIQLTQLLYLVLQSIDGQRSYGEIAATVSESMGRGVSGEQVQRLADSKLQPLGVLRRPDGSQPELKKANPLLALRFRYVVSDPQKTRRLTAPFAALFQPLVVTALTLAFLATAGWVLFHKGLAAATHQAFDKPGLLLGLFAITILSAGFHEFGHAAACRYGGATPGAMGAGLYLVWPAFYTEVTDSYRLGRAGRVRVDLGGLYFNAIFALGSFALWAATRWDAVLLLIAAQVLQMLRQLAPFVRFDGYHILADLTGVPDLYHHIKPTLLSLLPWRWGKGEPSALKRWARAVVTVWVLVVVPLLLASLVMMVVALPRVLATGWASLGRQWGLLGYEWSGGDFPGVGMRVLSLVAIALPMLATVYLIVRVVRRLVGWVWRKTAGRPVQRGLAAVVAAALVAGLAYAWWPDEQRYRPIQATERGTVFDGLQMVQAGSARPSDTIGMGRVGRVSKLREGQVSGARTIVAPDTKLGTRNEPQLALVLVPEAGSDAPTWVFPFNKPAPPGAGDNQALAVNTEDGSTQYDVAFALVWADGDSVLNKNEAYAFASCTACTTVAVGFQVVLIVGQADVIVPQNLSAAANYACTACVTYALAKQIIISLPDGLSPEATARLNALWEEIRKFGDQVQQQHLSVEEIYARLATYEKQITQIVDADKARVTTGTSVATASPTPSSAASPSMTGSPDAGATTGSGTGTGGSGAGAAPGADPTSGTGGASAPPSSAAASPSPSAGSTSAGPSGSASPSSAATG